MITALTISLIVFFFHACTWEGMIFHFVEKTLKDVPVFLKKPLFSCPTCMTMWWGGPVYAVMILAGWPVVNFWQLVIILFLASGISTVINYLMTALKTFIVVYDQMECDCITKKAVKESRLHKLSSFKNYQT